MAQSNAQRNDDEPEEQSGGRPIEKVRVGAIAASIWRNEGQNGDFFSVTFERTYTDKDGKPQSAHSFGRDDLLVLAKVADRAHDKIVELQQGRARA
jgi:hypothetical protein